MRRILALLILLLLLPIMEPTVVHAQASNMTRQQRLKEHERKIKEIIEERRRQTSQEQAQKAAEPVAEEPVPEEEGPKKAISSVVMGFKFTNDDGDSNYNIIVRQGDTFLSEVYMFNIDQNPIDRVRLALSYDKRFIEPVKVFDTSLRPQVKGEPTFRRDDREAILHYDAEFETPVMGAEVVLLRILWQAVRTTPYTGITFAFDELERHDRTHTAIYADGSNILGTRDDPMDGVLSGGLMIDLPGEDEEHILQGKAEELRELYLGSVASTATVGLQLFGPQETPRVGDTFRVRVRLNNPEGALVDAVNFFVKFDPAVLQVVDRDDFNWINRGVNVHDGPYTHYFPWDMHKRNEVRNDRGMVNYQKSLSNGASLPSRVFADIYFQAVAPAANTDIYLIQGRLSETFNTSVRYFGYERIDLLSELSTPLIRMDVMPPPVQVVTSTTTDVDAEVKAADSLQVRPLMIER